MEALSLDIKDFGVLWQAAAIVLGFKMAFLAWRIRRELEMERKGETTWVPFPEILTFLSAFLLVLGVFVLPILAGPDLPIPGKSLGLSARIFGLSLVIFVLHPLLLAGHYNLFWREKNPSSSSTSRVRYRCSSSGLASDSGRPWLTKQERVAWALAGLLILAYIAFAELLYWGPDRFCRRFGGVGEAV